MAIRKAVADSGSYEPSGPASWGRLWLLVGVNPFLDTEASPSLETERFIDYGFHSSTCLALQQHQIKSRQDRGTIKCPASSVFNSSVLHGEVDSSVLDFFFQAYFWETTFTAFARKCHYASGAGKGESNFIIVKCLTRHYPP